MRRQSAKTQMIHARIEPKLKRSAERIFSEVGMSTTEAIRLFSKQVELHRGLPFLRLYSKCRDSRCHEGSEQSFDPEAVSLVP
jgi:addiction module RelB/DinJ family antitoxin